MKTIDIFDRLNESNSPAHQLIRAIYSMGQAHPFERGVVVIGLRHDRGDSAVSLELQELRGMVVVKNMHTIEGQQMGAGGYLMGQITKKADELGVALVLNAVPFTKEISKSKLVSFYKKHGFQKGKYGGYTFDMYREPKQS